MADEKTGTEATAVNFGEFIKTQPDNVRAAFDEHTKGLKTALDSEREARKNFETQLKAQMATVEGEGKKKLEALLAERDEANAAASFYEGAISEGVNNPKLALIAAKSDGLIKNGRTDWAALKKAYPELFAKTGTLPWPGEGSHNKTDLKPGDFMNDMIRGKAARN